MSAIAFHKIPEVAEDGDLNLGEVGILLNENFQKAQSMLPVFAQEAFVGAGTTGDPLKVKAGLFLAAADKAASLLNQDGTVNEEAVAANLAKMTTVQQARQLSRLGLDLKTDKNAFNQVYLLDFLNPTDTNTHTLGYQQAVDLTIARGGDLIFPQLPVMLYLHNTITYRPRKNVYQVVNGVETDTLVSQGATEFHMRIQGQGEVYWVGGSNKSIMDVVGMRGSTIENVSIRIPNGVSGVRAWNVDTANASRYYRQINSTSHIKWTNCAVILGNGANSGWTWGATSGGGGDLSQLDLDRCTAYGNDGGVNGQLSGALQSTIGSIGLEILGHNTLNNQVTNCLLAYVDVAVFNTGNGAITFTNTTFSHNRWDYDLASISNYVFNGCRHEDGLFVLRHRPSIDTATLTFHTCEINNYVGMLNWDAYQNGGAAPVYGRHLQRDANGNLLDAGAAGTIIHVGRPDSIQFLNCHISNDVEYGQHMAIFESFSGDDNGVPGRKGVVQFIGGGVSSVAEGFTRIENTSSGVPRFLLYRLGVQRLKAGNQSWNGDGLAMGMFQDLIAGAPIGAAPATSGIGRFFLEYGPNVYMKNDGGNFILQAGGNDIMEATPGRLYLKKPTTVQGFDLEFESAGNGLVTTSPNGTKWRLSVTDAGQPVFTHA